MIRYLKITAISYRSSCNYHFPDFQNKQHIIVRWIWSNCGSNLRWVYDIHDLYVNQNETQCFNSIIKE
jgi:hypothetical protein